MEELLKGELPEQRRLRLDQPPQNPQPVKPLLRYLLSDPLPGKPCKRESLPQRQHWQDCQQLLHQLVEQRDLQAF